MRTLAYIHGTTQFEIIPMFWVSPAGTCRLLAIVPNLVWVNRKTSSLHLFTTFSDWAVADARKVDNTEKVNRDGIVRGGIPGIRRTIILNGKGS
jgi:hypothetical protein